MLAWYSRQVTKRPVLAQCVMSASLISTGDVISQLLFSEKAYDYKRTAKFGLIGLCFSGPVLANWYIWLEKFAGQNVVKKVVWDQFVLQAPFTTGVLILNGALNGAAFNESISMVKANLPGMLAVAWPYWCTVQAVNFKLTPFNYRMLVMQVAAIFWNVFLCWKASNAVEVSDKLAVDKQD